jgi:hypothetical protein
VNRPWVCARCRTPVSGTRFDAYCPQCHDKTIATEDAPLAYVQYREICDLFTAMGDINRASRLRRIGRILRRQVRDYSDMTATEGGTALAALREEARPKTTGEVRGIRQ